MVEIPNPDSIERIADWIELKILISNERISRASITSIIDGATGSEPQESFISSIWRELEYRQSLYSKSFFKVSDRSIEPKRRKKSRIEYCACLLLSMFGVQGEVQRPTKLFEKLVCYAVKLYLSGKAVVFGFPDLDPDKETTTQAQKKMRLIERKMRQIAEDLNEKFIEPPSSHDAKDRGVDVIGWIPFDEKRSSQIVILMQCAAGHNWKDKHEVYIDAWCDYIQWGRRPIHAFAVPCIIPENDWKEKSRDKGLLFDRARIINLLSFGKPDSQLTKDINSWITTQYPELHSTT